MRPPRKLGGWAERWDSRETRTIKGFGIVVLPVQGSRESQRSAQPPSLRGGRIYIVEVKALDFDWKKWKNGMKLMIPFFQSEYDTLQLLAKSFWRITPIFNAL